MSGMAFASPQGCVHGGPGNATPTGTESWREIHNEATFLCLGFELSFGYKQEPVRK